MDSISGWFAFDAFYLIQRRLPLRISVILTMDHNIDTLTLDHDSGTDNITYFDYTALYFPNQSNWIAILGIIIFCLIIITAVAFSQRELLSKRISVKD